ncbi:ADP-ribose pyrophosphatase [Thiohalobacter sp. COW1]|uniref:ADP-ribose pyrophosphatase n=1 Tax=Thiohalobacter thiocyanaticus TaxID=585455 RepID=A0A1Z4VUG0_9GAMM|nr:MULTISPECIES: NUDIX hydrolase [Thiohalobacter]BAZ95095.1 ADP-ribose pyrophosphatase [Thiohalobacter thiocyanaticus]BCO32976.1 ADP-ribose pyrophosphatase [Thiohalobacter sp. COW1]
MKFCSECAAPVSLQIPAGDDRPRYVCDSCRTIHYQNPNIVAGCIAEWEGRVLLCRRAIEPRYGLWTLPAGFMELGETTQQAAARETLEETNARVALDALYAVFNLPHIDQVYMLFRGRLQAPDFSAGQESLEAALFDRDDVPWDALAFQVVAETLKLYFEEQPGGRYGLHLGDIERLSHEPPRYRIRYL